MITERQLVGSLQGKSIWKATAVEMFAIPLLYSGANSEQQRAYDAHLSNMRTFLSEALFYFSYDFSLTQTQQRLNTVPKESGNDDTAESSPLYQMNASDERFLWNEAIAAPFLAKPGLARYIVAAIDGFAQSAVLHLRGMTVRLTLLSRRTQHRAGTRFLTRGIDPSGNVANFCETEQILELVDKRIVYSWVTVRGSIPVFWSQTGQERIPPPVVHHRVWSKEAFRKHMTSLEEHYGAGITLLNLIDHNGKEAALGEAYEMAVRLDASNLRYVSVDFHQLTRGNRYDRLSELMSVLADNITSELWYSRIDSTLASIQRSVARTNCIDW